jgi:hypothetical protein
MPAGKFVEGLTVIALRVNRRSPFGLELLKEGIDRFVADLVFR